MATLYDQPPRSNSLQNYVSDVISTADTMFPGITIRGMSVDQWQAAARVTEVALQIQNADARDEQLAGFGELAQDAISALRETKS